MISLSINFSILVAGRRWILRVVLNSNTGEDIREANKISSNMLQN